MEFMLGWFIFTKRIVSFREHWFFFSGGTYFGRMSQPLVGWLVIINNLSNQLILSFTPKKHRWWPLLIVLFKIGGTSTTVTGVEVEFWNKNNNKIHLMFERINKHVHLASISMTTEMWSVIMIICCWAAETIENSSPRQCNTWGLQTHHHSLKNAADMAVLLYSLGNSSALFFGQALDQMGQKCRYLAKNASFGPNLAVFGPKIQFFGGRE